MALSVELIRAGASLVLWAGQYLLDEHTGEARQIDGDLYRVDTRSSPIFKPQTSKEVNYG